MPPTTATKNVAKSAAPAVAPAAFGLFASVDSANAWSGPASAMKRPPSATSPFPTKPTTAAEAPSKKKAPSEKALHVLSRKIVQKIRAKVRTTYNELADELVRENNEELKRKRVEEAEEEARARAEGRPSLAKKAKGQAKPPATSGTGRRKNNKGGDDKNIRRRVYDALNVMDAAGVIEKNGKEVVWIGISDLGMQEMIGERDELVERLKQKRERLRETLGFSISYANLIRRNLSRDMAAAPPVSPPQANPIIPVPMLTPENTSAQKCKDDANADNGERILLPFIAVSVPATSTARFAQEENEVLFEFSEPFEIDDDYEVLRRLGLSTTTVDDLKQLLPSKVFEYVQTHGILDDVIVGPKQSEGAQGQSGSVPGKDVAGKSTWLPGGAVIPLTAKPGASLFSASQIATPLPQCMSSISTAPVTPAPGMLMPVPPALMPPTPVQQLLHHNQSSHPEADLFFLPSTPQHHQSSLASHGRMKGE